MTLAHLVYRIASDPSFAARFAKEPHAAFKSFGIALDRDSVLAALSVLGDYERTLCSSAMRSKSREWYRPNHGGGVVD